MKELLKSREYKTLLRGEVFLIFTALLLRIAKPVLAGSLGGGDFPWANQLGAIMFFIAMIAFVLERMMKLPFFYGRSQSCGSNANSFFVFAVAINCFSLSIGGFALLLFATVLILAAVFMLIHKIRC